MPRTRPPERLQNIVQAATDVFIEAGGYQRAQMADIAEAAGVSKGTLYLYVESKEAIFDLCVRHADVGGTEEHPKALPVPTPRSGETMQYIQERLANDPTMAELAEILMGDARTSAHDELASVVRLLYRTLYANSKAIKLVDVAAKDHPELSGLWFTQARGGLLTLLVPYLEGRVSSGQFLPVADVSIAARFLIETCVLWAVHRHWDPSPQEFDEDDVLLVLTEMLCRAFIGECRP